MSVARQTILLVEDDPNDILLFQRVFGRAYPTKPVQAASNGEEAVAYLEGQGSFADRRQYPIPALVFLDLKLPGISGFEVLTWVRQQPRLKRLQVVVLTGSPLTIDIYRAYELGANSYLVKPVTPETLAGLAKSLKISWLAPGNTTAESAMVVSPPAGV
jgi:CheY-like chemotaxis protein